MPRGPVADSEVFKKWFRDSKVVDDQGNPLVVFHGTPNGEVPEFEGGERGAFFTDNSNVAAGYTNRRGVWMTPGDAPAIQPVYLAIKNPLIIDALGKRNDNIPVPWAEWKPKVFGRLPLDAVSVSGALKYAVNNGYDGLIVRNVVDNAFSDDKTKSTVYAVTDPARIKFAAGAYKESIAVNDAPLPSPPVSSSKSHAKLK